MQIGIIGTGNIGATLAAGHDICVANSSGREGVRQFADETGAKAVGVYGAVDGVDVIILSIRCLQRRTCPPTCSIQYRRM